MVSFLSFSKYLLLNYFFLKIEAWLIWAFLVSQLVKNPPAMHETPVQFLGQEDPLEKDRLHPPVFLGFPPGWCGRPAVWETWVQSLGWEDPWRQTWQPTPVFLPGESPQREEPGGRQSMGSQRVGHDWTTKDSTALLICNAVLNSAVERSDSVSKYLIMQIQCLFYCN